MQTVTLPARPLGIAALALVVLGAAARPLRGELTVSQALAALAIIIPAALLPALLVRFAEARRWLAFSVIVIVSVIPASSAVALLARSVPVHPLKGNAK